LCDASHLDFKIEQTTRQWIALNPEMERGYAFALYDGGSRRSKLTILGDGSAWVLAWRRALCPLGHARQTHCRRTREQA